MDTKAPTVEDLHGFIMADQLPQLQVNDLIRKAKGKNLHLTLQSSGDEKICFGSPVGLLVVKLFKEHLLLREGMLARFSSAKRKAVAETQAYIGIYPEPYASAPLRELDRAVFTLALSVAELCQTRAMFFNAGINAHELSTYQKEYESLIDDEVPIPGPVDIDVIPLPDETTAVQTFGLNRYGHYNVCVMTQSSPEGVDTGFSIALLVSRSLLAGCVRLEADRLFIVDSKHVFPYSLRQNQAQPDQQVIVISVKLRPRY